MKIQKVEIIGHSVSPERLIMDGEHQGGAMFSDIHKKVHRARDDSCDEDVRASRYCKDTYINAQKGHKSQATTPRNLVALDVEEQGLNYNLMGTLQIEEKGRKRSSSLCENQRAVVLLPIVSISSLSCQEFSPVGIM